MYIGKNEQFLVKFITAWCSREKKEVSMRLQKFSLRWNSIL